MRALRLVLLAAAPAAVLTAAVPAAADPAGIAAAAATAATAPTAVAAAARLPKGSQVTVAGTVARHLDEDEILLADATGAILVYGGPGLAALALGEAVTVLGLIDRDGPVELYAITLSRADGGVLRFDPDW
jgi:hypothetical protein